MRRPRRPLAWHNADFPRVMCVARRTREKLRASPHARRHGRATGKGARLAARIESESSGKGRNSHTTIHAQLRRREPPDRASHTACRSSRPSVRPSVRPRSIPRACRRPRCSRPRLERWRRCHERRYCRQHVSCRVTLAAVSSAARELNSSSSSSSLSSLGVVASNPAVLSGSVCACPPPAPTAPTAAPSRVADDGSASEGDDDVKRNVASRVGESARARPMEAARRRPRAAARPPRRDVGRRARRQWWRQRRPRCRSVARRRRTTNNLSHRRDRVALCVLGGRELGVARRPLALLARRLGERRGPPRAWMLRGL